MVLFVSIGLGCASDHKTTKTETTVTRPSEPVVTTGQQSANQGGKSETTTTTTETKARHPGIVSSTFHAIGYVLELPFIAIGSLFRAMFGS